MLEQCTQSPRVPLWVTNELRHSSSPACARTTSRTLRSSLRSCSYRQGTPVLYQQSILMILQPAMSSPAVSPRYCQMTYIALDNLADITSCLFQDSLDALRTFPCLLCDVSFDEFALLVGGDLSGNVDCVASLDSLCL
jgi:hypothetical protein